MSQENKYTKPQLRDNIKDRVMAGSKGGKPGQQFCAIVRKAQTTQCKSSAVNVGSESRMKILAIKDEHQQEI